MARITIYRNSVLATLVSIIAYMFVGVGIMIAFNGQIIGGILLALVGVVLMALASSISTNKQFKMLKKDWQAKGLIPEIQSNVSVAIQAYNTLPCPKMLAYIRTLNPEAAVEIARQLEAKKKK